MLMPLYLEGILNGMNWIGLSKPNARCTVHSKIFSKSLNGKASNLPQPGKYIEKVFIRRYIFATINSYIFFSKTLEKRNRRKNASTI